MGDPRRRVKVYHLEDDERWADRGTGHISLVRRADAASDDDGPLYSIRVVSEVDNVILLDQPLRIIESYCLQEGTLIVWSEVAGDDLAVSFQEARGCLDFWNELILRCNDNQKAEPFLPEPTIENLPAILASISKAFTMALAREHFSMFLVKTNYIKQLSMLFETLESTNAKAELSILFAIVRDIILLGDPEIFAVLVDDMNLENVLGILEYDKSVSNLPGTFRSFFKNEAKFINVVKCLPNEFRAKVASIFRLQYLRDVAVARYLDDPVFNRLSECIKRLHQDVFLILLKNLEFVEEILLIFDKNPSFGSNVDLFVDNKSSLQRVVNKRQAAVFLKDLACAAKQCLTLNPSEIFSGLAKAGIFNVFNSTLNDDDYLTRQAISEFLCSIVEVDRKLAQSKCVEHNLLPKIIDRLGDETDLGLLPQWVELLKLLMEPEPVLACDPILLRDTGAFLSQTHATPEYEAFLTHFYECAAPRLLKGLSNAVNQKIESRIVEFNCKITVFQLPSSMVERVYQMMELIVLLSSLSASRFRSEILGSLEFLDAYRVLLVSTHKHIQLSCIRIAKILCVLRDESFLVENNMIVPILQALVLTEGKQNLVNSAILHFFESFAAIATQLGKTCMLKAKEYWSSIQYANVFGSFSTESSPTGSRCVTPENQAQVAADPERIAAGLEYLRKRGADKGLEDEECFLDARKRLKEDGQKLVFKEIKH